MNLHATGKGFFASVAFQLPSPCATFAYESGLPSPAKSSSGGVEVRGKGTISVAGEPFDVEYDLTVTNDLVYKLTADVKPKDPSTPCAYSGTITGILSGG